MEPRTLIAFHLFRLLSTRHAPILSNEEVSRVLEREKKPSMIGGKAGTEKLNDWGKLLNSRREAGLQRGG